MKRVVVLGSTGSVGQQALEVIRRQPQQFRVVGLTAGRNLELLLDQAQEFQPQAIGAALASAAAIPSPLQASAPIVRAGLASLTEVALLPGADIVLVATTGLASLPAILATLESGRDVALANKESIVAASTLLLAAAQRSGAQLLPVDSEPSAIFQCLVGEDRSRVARILLTASGGPFRAWSPAAMQWITPAQALAHPTWRMGAKITVDSATLMNKGLEVLEAGALFDVPLEQVQVVVHPQSIVHSLVEFADGSVKAQLGYPDMQLPIEYALAYPERLPRNDQPLDLAALGQLTFSSPDLERFPCLGLAREAGRLGGTALTALCAADEVAVQRFLQGHLRFTDIPHVVQAVLEEHPPAVVESIEQIWDVDRWAQTQAEGIVRRLAERSQQAPVLAQTL